MRTKSVLTVIALLSLSGITIAFARSIPQDSPNQLTPKEALALVRTLNSAEQTIKINESNYCALDVLLKRADWFPRQSEIVLSDNSSGTLKGYRLSVVVSADGKHYQLSLRPPSGCGVAYFTSDSGVIYEGKGLGCPTS